MKDSAASGPGATNKGIKMHESLLCVRWETPVSDANVLMMKLCSQNGELDITLDRSSVSETQRQIQIGFRKVSAFRCILEKFRIELWNSHSANERPGRTFIIENSPWIAELKTSEPIFSALNKDTRHYVIATDWDVVEILSSHAPAIVKL
jgi:hypothetical protein